MNGDVGIDVISEVQRKLDGLVKSRGVSFLPVLIHANTVSESVVMGDFFDEIIDMGQFL
jgi:hypothetical protein